MITSTHTDKSKCLCSKRLQPETELMRNNQNPYQCGIAEDIEGDILDNYNSFKCKGVLLNGKGNDGYHCVYKLSSKAKDNESSNLSYDQYDDDENGLLDRIPDLGDDKSVTFLGCYFGNVKMKVHSAYHH